MLRSLPNLLSAFRLVMVPVLLWLAWHGHGTAFLLAFGAALASDVADGFVARRTGTSSELGAKLDSWGDLANYLVLPISAWWLWPERILAQLALVAIALVAFLAPTLVGFLKFRRLTSYHTRAAKLSAIVMGSGLLLYLGAGVVWLFQIAVILLVIEAIEEIAITTVLPEWRANVPSIFEALRVSRGSAVVIATVALGMAVAGANPAAAQALPDLVPEVSDIELHFNTTVNAGDVVEECASATSGVDLLRLALTTRNDGPASIELGNPGCPNCASNPNVVCGNPLFICSPAGGHNHPHYQNFMRYELLDPNGVQVGLGGKRSFCLLESGCLGPNANHTCNNQGLGAGCWDIYPSYLGCQYVEITGVPEGVYTLRVTIDPNAEIEEANETNNVLDQPIVIVRSIDADVGLIGRSLLIRSGKLLRLRTRPVSDEPLPGTTGDPTLGGAVLHVIDTLAQNELEFVLPAEGWSAIGRDAKRGYRYRGAGTDADPCKSVVVRRNRVEAKCRGSAINLELPVAGEVFIQLELGVSARRYCASFGGQTRQSTAEVLKRRHAALATCSPTF
jgi:CDP-diacylglycerol--glycerol-3-phosphate 3-phosphatidyltransferase